MTDTGYYLLEINWYFYFWILLFLVPLSQLLWQQRRNNLPSKWPFASRISKTSTLTPIFFSCILFLQTWTMNRKIIKKFCNVIFFSEAKNSSFFDNIFLALQNFFIIFLLIVHAWRKSMQEKKGGHRAYFWNTQSKRPIWRQVVTSLLP